MTSCTHAECVPTNFNHHPAPHSMPERPSVNVLLRRERNRPSATEFPPPDPECSSCSIGRPDLRPMSDGQDQRSSRTSADAFSPALVAATFFGCSFFFQLSHQFRQHYFRIPLHRASCTFARFVVGSLFFPELLFFFKVDLLSRFDCTGECADHCSLTPSVIGGSDLLIPSHRTLPAEDKRQSAKCQERSEAVADIRPNRQK